DDLGDTSGAEVVLVRCPARGGQHTAQDAHAAVQRAFRIAQQWVSDSRDSGSRLVFVTTRAVAVLPDEDVPDLASAPVWGLVRSVQSEHPGRVVIVDTDGRDGDETLLLAAVASGEPQVAIRDGELRVPRLVSAA